MDENLRTEIKKRVEKVIEEDDASMSDSFRTLEGNAQLSLFPPEVYVHDLDIEGLRELPLYLSESQFFSSSQLSDNYHYWGWTLVCINSVHFPERDLVIDSNGVVNDISGILKVLYLRNVENILRNIGQQKRKQSSKSIPIEHTIEQLIPYHEIQNHIARAAYSTLERACHRIHLIASHSPVRFLARS